MLTNVIVYENDCLDEAREGAARHAGRQGVWQSQLGCAISFGQCWERPLTQHIEIFENAPLEEKPKRRLILIVSSDKGLCGGVHSSVSKATRRAVAEAGPEVEQPIMVIGDKSKAQIARVLSGNLVLTFNQIGRDIPTFTDAASVADLITKSGIKYDIINIVYNKFVSVMSYESAVYELANEEGLKEARELHLLLIR